VSCDQPSSTSSRMVISTLPRSAFETGQRSAACAILGSSPALSSPGTRARTVSSTVVIRGAPSTSSSVQAAVTARRSGGVSFSAQHERERHRKTAGVSGGDQLLGAGLAVRLLGTRRPADRELERAAPARQHPGSPGEGPVPNHVGLSQSNRHLVLFRSSDWNMARSDKATLLQCRVSCGSYRPTDCRGALPVALPPSAPRSPFGEPGSPACQERAASAFGPATVTGIPPRRSSRRCTAA
jgi:hypothetical protein